MTVLPFGVPVTSADPPATSAEQLPPTNAVDEFVTTTRPLTGNAISGHTPVSGPTENVDPDLRNLYRRWTRAIARR